MIEVYLQRHGIAAESNPEEDDSSRAVTVEGKRRLRCILRRARKAGVRPEVVLSSPYKRAVQTAELAVRELGCPGVVHETKALAPGSSPDEIWDEVRAHRKSARILLSGHEPLLSQTAAYLLDSPGLRIDFKKGALIRIDFETASSAPRGVLKWMITPSTAV